MTMQPVKQPKTKARPFSWTRLFLMVCLSLCIGVLGSQGLDYVLSLQRETETVTPPQTRALPPVWEDEMGKIDVNQATAADFQQAYGIGPVLAQAIVDYRDSVGGFYYIEELMDVSGIGEKRFDALRELFYCPEN